MNAKKFIVCMAILMPLSASTIAGVLPEDITEIPEYGLVVGFLDSFTKLLEEPESEEKEIRLQRLYDDGVEFIKGNPRQLLDFNPNLDFELSSADNEYILRWTQDDEVKLALRIPANVQILTMSDKTTLEKRLYSLFEKNEMGRHVVRPTVATKSLKKSDAGSFYLEDKGWLIHPELACRLIYEPINRNECTLLYNTSEYALETINNMLLSGYTESPVYVEMRVPDGLNSDSSITVPFATLYSVFSAEDCHPYWAVTSGSGKCVKGIYLWEQPNGGYVHMISLEMETETPSKGGTVQGTLTPYIRTDNLKHLFGEFEEK